MDVRPVRNLDALRGQEIRMRVIKVNKKRGNIVLSRKGSSRKRTPRRRSTRSRRWPRARLRGVVKNITDYGAFIDLGGIDGLLHIADMRGAASHPSEMVQGR